jgi:CHAT domain-containing protein
MRTNEFRPALSALRARFRLGALACLVFAYALHGTIPELAPERRGQIEGHDELVAALVSSGRVMGRLVGGGGPPRTNRGLTHAPPETRLSADLQSALAKVELSARSFAEPRGDAPLALVSMARGDADRALKLLEFALDGEPHNARLWSDAAAVYLTVHTRHDRPELAVRALAASAQALALQPDLREAQYNRAMALEAVGLLDQARHAWQAYAITPGDHWQAQAVGRGVALVDMASTLDEWKSVRERLARAADERRQALGGTTTALVPFRQRLREWIEEELLPEWGRAVLDGNSDRSDRVLVTARYIAEMLVRAHGDEQPLQGIRAIVSVQDPVAKKRLGSAHVALADAIRLFDDGAVSAAVSRFRKARPALLAAGSTYAKWSTVYESVSLYADRQLARAFDVASAPGAPGPRYRYLHGRQAWLKGLTRLHQGRLSAALAHYTEALADFEAVGEHDSATAMSSLVAESLFSLGERSRAWRHQYKAVREARTLTVVRRRHLVLLTAGLMCIEEGLPRAALEFQDAVIADAQATKVRPSSLLNAYLQRSRNRHALGNVSGAVTDLEQARKQLHLVQEPLLRRRDEAEIQAATALILGTTGPTEARVAATRAIEYFGHHDGRLFLPGLFLARARASRAMGRVTEAEADARRAIATFENQRSNVVETEHRVRLFEDGWNAYDELMALRVDAGDGDGALDIAERARARTLLEDLVAQRDAQPASLSELQPALPPDTAVLYYVSRADRLWLWIVTRGGTRFFDRPVSAASLRRTVERLRHALAQETPRSIRAALQDLFGALIAPALAEIAPYPTLMVVPDGALHVLPFAALQDPATGRYLVERHVVVVAPSLNIMARPLQPRPRKGGRTLVVANTRYVPGLALPQLAFARAEATAIAALYGSRAELLLDDDATATAFKSRLEDADVVHYAGHAISDARAPEHSRLVLSAAAGETDPAMYASELRNVRLRKHPVVVLASCSTHAGRIAVAEGLQSLARPFLAAGASAVVASLWDVRDSDAAPLLTDFHRRLRAGDAAAQAVASIQRAAIARDRSIEAVPRWSWPVSIGGGVRSGTDRRH